MARALLAASLLLAGSNVWAQAPETETPPASAPPTDAVVSEVPAAAPAERSLKLRGFVSTAIAHNFTYPGVKADLPLFNAQNPGVRPFDFQFDTFSVDLAQVSFQYLATNPGEAGFRIDLNTGYSIPRRAVST